jgi:hypothetical protein
MDLKQARTIAVDAQKRIATNFSETGELISDNLYQFRLNQRSSFNLKLKGSNANATVDLLQDRNNNGQIDRGELMAKSKRSGNPSDAMKINSLKQGTYFIRVTPNANARSYQLVLSATPQGQSSLATGTNRFNSWSATQNRKVTGEQRRSGYQLQRGESGQFYIRQQPSSIQQRSLNRSERKTTFQKAKASGAVDRWNASFINRNSRNYANYRGYNFNNPDASLDLGTQGKSGTIIARLKQDYGEGSPNRSIKTRYFAMQAWTRVQLEDGKFYRITSQSDDGTRFLFKQPGTNQTVTEIGGDWRNRTTKQGPWSQMVVSGQGGAYDFYVQYYEKTGNSTINVQLEEVQPTSRVVSTSAINLRGQASTVGNNPTGSLNPGDTFTVLKKVRSANDAAYPDWYQIATSDGRQGFVAADSRLVQLAEDPNAATIGGSQKPTPTPSTPVDVPGSGTVTPPLPGGGTSSGGTKGFTFSTSYARDNTYFKQDLAEISSPYYYSSSYKPMIEEVAARYDWLQPSVIAAIGSRESAWGLLLAPKGPGGTGDGGHGRGLMQIDDRFHQTFISSGKWRDPKENLNYGIESVLKPNYNYLDRNTNLQGKELLRAALASYNAGLGNVMDAYEAGLDVDYYTTGKDYGRDVLDRAGWFQLQGWN